MTLSKSALLKSAYRFPTFCIVSLVLTAPVLGAESSQELDELFDSAESLVPVENAASTGKKASTAQKNSESHIPVSAGSFAEHLADAQATVPPPPAAIENETDIVETKASESEGAEDLSELLDAVPEAEVEPATETEIASEAGIATDSEEASEADVAAETEVASDVATENAVETEKAATSKLDPGIELLRLREESSALKEQLKLVDSNVAERDVKIGELQEEIAKITDERNAISNELQRTKAELTERIQMLQTKSNVLEQSIQQQVQMQQDEQSRQSTREARYKGVVNRYLDPNVEYFTPTYFE